MNLPYIAKIGETEISNDYVTEFEVKIPDLDSDLTKRSAKGVLTRDRLAQIPTVTIVLKRGIPQEDSLLETILTEIRKPSFLLEWCVSWKIFNRTILLRSTNFKNIIGSRFLRVK